jgi:uncharacterized membrane protein
MIFLLQLFTVLLALCVIGLLLIPLAAIWETIRANKEFKKLERERRAQDQEPASIRREEIGK